MTSSTPHPVADPVNSAGSRFQLTEDRMRAAVASANDRAAALAERIMAARHAVRRGESGVSVLAILDGADTEGLAR